MGCLQSAKFSFLFVFGKKSPQIWARHSYALGTLVPFLSDLDITLLYDTPPTRHDFQRHFEFLRGVRSLVPVFSESNVYVLSEDLDWLARINPLELSRDPKLRKYLLKRAPLSGPWDSRPTNADVAVFLLRQLESDFKNLFEIPKFRKKKWRSHFEAAGFHLEVDSELSFESVVRQCLASVAAILGGQLLALELEIRHYFERRLLGTPQYELTGSPNLVALFPHRFLHDQSAINSIPGDLQEIVLAQFSWELWGIGSQFRRIGIEQESATLRHHLVGHFEKMQNALSNLPGAGNSTARLIHDIERFKLNYLNFIQEPSAARLC